MKPHENDDYDICHLAAMPPDQARAVSDGLYLLLNFFTSIFSVFGFSKTAMVTTATISMTTSDHLS